MLTLLMSASDHGLGGSWTIKGVKYKVNEFKPHSYSLAVSDTTMRPHAKLILDFYRNFPAVSGTYRVAKGSPNMGEIGIGAGIPVEGKIVMYSGAGSKKETVNVTVDKNYVTISGTNIQLANQNNPKDLTAISLSVTTLPQ